MIWALLVLIGIPMWLIAIALFALLRGRSHVRRIPGSFPCKVRLVSGSATGVPDSFPRYASIAHWVHDVLIVHGGSPFLLRTTPLGVSARTAPPTSIPVKGFTTPVVIGFRLDSGAGIEVVTEEVNVDRILGPFA